MVMQFASANGPAGCTAQAKLGNLATDIGNKAGCKVSTHKVEVTKVLSATVLRVRHAIGFGDALASMAVNTTRKTIQAAEKVVKQLDACYQHHAFALVAQNGREPTNSGNNNPTACKCPVKRANESKINAFGGS